MTATSPNAQRPPPPGTGATLQFDPLFKVWHATYKGFDWVWNAGNWNRIYRITSATPAPLAAPPAAPPALRYPLLHAEPGVDLQHEQHSFLAELERFAEQVVRGPIDIFSAYRPPWSPYGFAGDPHQQGLAVDARVERTGKPLGTVAPESTFERFGLVSGNQPNFYQGRPDPSHVQSQLANQAAPQAGKSAGSSADVFFQNVLADLKLPITNANIVFLESWASLEGTKARNNPLATTQHTGNSRPLPGNSAGVQEYPTSAEGAQATAQTLRGYPAILGLFRTGNAIQASFGAHPTVDQEFRQWSGGGYGLDKVRLAAQGNPKGKSASDIGSYDLGNAAKDLGKLDPFAWFNFLTSWRVWEVVGGFFLLIVGLYLLGRQYGVTPPASGIAKAGIAFAK